MTAISELQPKALWQWFERICAIPHPSHYEEELAQFILNRAKNKGFFAERDEAGNVLIRKPASAGMENRRPVVLQAHLDMVPQANEGSAHNFRTDSVKPYIDGDWVKAQDTTLGADNGIGMASALAVLECEDLAHPDLEVLLTVTEETGMEGARGLGKNWLQGELMINTDTEKSGEIYIGCAGGADANLTIPIERQNNPFGRQYQVTLKGLRGGHSGCDIHTGRANAIKLMARFLVHLNETRPHFEFVLSDIRGGSVRNAIPREAFAVLAFDDEAEVLQSAVQNFEILLRREYAELEPNLSFTLEPAEKPAHVFNYQDTQNVMHALNAVPNGVIRNSETVQGGVETSLSTGVLKTEENCVRASILIRSLNESGKQYVQELLTSLTVLSGDDVKFSGSYPGWEPEPHSALTDLTKRIYDKILDGEAKIKVIHAGLECGLIKEKYPYLDVVSVGPTIINAHSPDEKVHIPAVLTYWRLLTELLANIPSR